MKFIKCIRTFGSFNDPIFTENHYYLMWEEIDSINFLGSTKLIGNDGEIDTWPSISNSSIPEYFKV